MILNYVLAFLDQFIKVQIRRDLALDVSAVPADATLSALPAQAATPVMPVAKLGSKSLTPLTPQMHQALVEISNKTITFPTTPSGETSGTAVHNSCFCLHVAVYTTVEAHL